MLCPGSFYVLSVCHKERKILPKVCEFRSVYETLPCSQNLSRLQKMPARSLHFKSFIYFNNAEKFTRYFNITGYHLIKDEFPVLMAK